MPATLGGGVIAITVSFTVIFISEPAAEIVFHLFPLIGGIATGAMQWLILRRRVTWSGWWVGIYILTWVVGVSGLMYGPDLLNGYGYLLLLWPSLAMALTLAPLVWLLKR